MIAKNKFPGPRRSLLFVPGNKPERFEKACASGADIVCIDLEDAVAPAEKKDARQAVCEYLQTQFENSVELVVRVNALSSDYGSEDMQSLSGCANPPNIVMLPKTESVNDIEEIAKLLPDNTTEVIALVETPLGILNLKDLSSDTKTLSMLMLGGADLSAAMNAKMNWDSLFYARSHMLITAALQQLGTIDVPFLDINDGEGLRAETMRIRDMGFTTKAAIHPKQISIINEVFSPSDEDIEKAQRIIDADMASGGDVTLVDGKMVDAPLVRSAQRIVNIAKSLGKISIN